MLRAEMMPIYSAGLTYSSVSVPTLKKWAMFLNGMMSLNLPEYSEALPKIQDIFAKLKLGDGIIDAAKMAATYPRALLLPSAAAPGLARAVPEAAANQQEGTKMARGASKRRYYLSLEFSPQTSLALFSITARRSWWQAAPK